MKWPSLAVQIQCDQAFHRWCAEAMIDSPSVRMRYGFVNGYLAALEREKQVESAPKENAA